MPVVAFGIQGPGRYAFSMFPPLNSLIFVQNLETVLLSLQLLTDPTPTSFRSGPYSVTENNSSSQKVARASADFTSQSRANLDSVSDSAVLYLLDTGIRAAGTPVNTDADREIFAASFLKIDPVPTATTNSNSSGDNNGNSNWTKELCRHLRNASRRNEPMTVAQLHGEMIQSLAEIGADGQRKLPVVPVHSQLISPMKGGSIVLAPESFRKWTGFGEFTEPDKGSQSGSDSHSDLVFSKVSKDHASPLEFGQQDHEHELTQAQEYRKPMSLISVRLHFESPIKGALPPLPVISVLVEELRRWLRELIDTTTTTITTHLPLLKPKSLTKIQLSAYCSPIPEPGPTHYPSFSGMRPTPASGPASGVVLLILLPIEVWDGMRADPAYSFVRFAMSAT